MVPARRSLPDGGTRIECGPCSFTFREIRPRILLVEIRGRDKGQFGSTVFEEIRLHMGQEPLELFVDASEADGPSGQVSEAWTRFLNREAPNLRRVSILALSRFVHLTVSVAKLFSRTGELVQIYSDPLLFKSAMERASRGR